MPRRQLAVFILLVGALYCLTWGRPWVATFVSADSLILRLGTFLVIGSGLALGGFFLARSGLRHLWGAITQQRLKCPSCKGTGQGERRWYEKFVNYGSDLMGNPVWIPQQEFTYTCWQCQGSGSLAVGTFQEGLVRSGGGAFLVCVGLIVLSGWRDWLSLPSAIPNQVLPSVAALLPAAGPESPEKALNSPAQPVPPMTGPALSPAPNDPEVPPLPPTPGVILVLGTERETNGHVWELRGELQVSGRGVFGPLNFTLKEAPPESRFISRVGSSAEMSVEGTAVGKKLILAGTRVSDPSLIGVGRYELLIDPASKTFSCRLPEAGGTLTGTVSQWSFD